MQRIYTTTDKLTDVLVDCIVRESNVDWSARGKAAQDIDEHFHDDMENVHEKLPRGETGRSHIVETETSFIDYIIYTVSPTYQKSNIRVMQDLVNCYKNCMKLANLKRALHVAFPVMGMGEGGYSMKEAVCAAMTAAKEWIEENKESSMEIYFCADDWDVMDQFNLYYPFCDWDSEEQYDDAMMEIMDKLLVSPVLPTRQKALEALEEMCDKAEDQRNAAVIQLYRRLLFDMQQTTDQTYDLLRENAKNKRDDTCEAATVRYVLESGNELFTKEMMMSRFKIPKGLAEGVLANLLRMKYIAFSRFNGKVIMYKVVIPEEDFYLIHGR